MNFFQLFVTDALLGEDCLPSTSVCPAVFDKIFKWLWAIMWICDSTFNMAFTKKLIKLYCSLDPFYKINNYFQSIKKLQDQIVITFLHSNNNKLDHVYFCVISKESKQAVKWDHIKAVILSLIWENREPKNIEGLLQSVSRLSAKNCNFSLFIMPKNANWRAKEMLNLSKKFAKEVTHYAFVENRVYFYFLILLPMNCKNTVTNELWKIGHYSPSYIFF